MFDAKGSVSRLAQRKKSEVRQLADEHFFCKRNDENGVFAQTGHTISGLNYTCSKNSCFPVGIDIIFER